MSKPLSKSRFKIGLECPTKLYYNERSVYGNKKDHDEFLKALADGGFQVGELAQLYHPGGVIVETLDYDKSIQETDELLKRDEVTIFEAAFRYENLFIRVDVLVKKGNEVELTEVKAKSFHSDEGIDIFNKTALKKGQYKLLSNGVTEKVLDLAFQTYVLRKAKPEFKINSGLMMADKSKIATVNGLHQLFLIQRGDSRRVKVKLTKPVSKKDLGQTLLTRVDLTDDIDKIISKAKLESGEAFEAVVEKLAALMESGERCSPAVGGHCKGCEFRIDKSKFASETKSGFEECWIAAKKLQATDFDREFAFDVWNFRGADDAISEGRIFASDLTEADINVKEREGETGWSRSERQMIQVEFAQGKRKGLLIDAEGLAAELKVLKAPYHFIDFETAMAAIPFHAGRHPYEQMAFQFSHHMIDANGKLTHPDNYIEKRVGAFPNFDFVRELKKALEKDNGTVFRFAQHENTVLNQIHAQLGESNEKDRDELMAWIETLTTPPSHRSGEWEPTRQFIDMCELTQKYYYLPETHGSNSIKKVLPAILNHAGRDLAAKFPDFIKIDSATGKADDPYKMLPPVFSDIPLDQQQKVEQWLLERDELNDGGAAMMAWGRMQFTEMSEVERAAIRSALLRYCGLDTLAMVMIWEWWILELKRAGKKVA